MEHLSKVKYSWIKNMILNKSNKESNRKIIFSNRKNELNLKMFQPLYDYYNFCKYFYGSFRIKNLDLDAISERILPYWTNYLVMLHFYSNEMKEAAIYFNPYNELSKLPLLTGDIDEDKKIMEDVIINNFYNPSSPTRQCIILLDTRIRNEWY